MTSSGSSTDASPEPPPTAPELVALCVVTYLRPVGLARLLRAIDALAGTGPALAVTVVIVDNDPGGSALPVVEEARAATDLDLVYTVEERRGITFARNRALEVVAGLDATWIGWLDDDEAPRPDWLHQVLAVQRETGADVVTGPSSPIYEPEAPPWIVATGAFEPEHFTTGQPYPYFHTRTSGVIHRASLVPREGFDNRLALTGGEDRLFFTRMHRAGASFVWADKAVVDEWVPTSRVDVGWLRRRWFRIGVSRSLTLLYLDNPSPLRRVRRFAGGLAMAARGLTEVALAAPKGRSAALSASRRMLIGLGSSWGALGRHMHEYRRIHGR